MLLSLSVSKDHLECIFQQQSLVTLPYHEIIGTGTVFTSFLPVSNVPYRCSTFLPAAFHCADSGREGGLQVEHGEPPAAHPLLPGDHAQQGGLYFLLISLLSDRFSGRGG
jgi:hypothetical protein